ncbi:chromosome segregation protein SMC [Pseudomonas sp. MYb187]|uniref:chromosome segregation protein SMC n=1 Tax=Pseudomonas TaxID=286 RepID=UPI000CFCAC70|nr:chromosome segregation protein SMC [Pseudomonas sp. MYb187]PRA58666.1 chromosome segregation protein SMC [Pseudomonas sp. MYb187]
MQSLEKLNTERSNLEAQIREIEGQIARWDEQLNIPTFAGTLAGEELLINMRNAESNVRNIEHKISVIDQSIAWIDRKANSIELMADYKEKMESWSLDKADLQGKRKTLSTRLEEVLAHNEQAITNARQAEEGAARAYAQAVAWGDADGEKTASADVQKAAKVLATELEQQRRQGLIVSALEQEIKLIDEHIEEAIRESEKIERSAVILATERLQEEWDAAVQQLIATGSKLYAGKRYMGWEQNAFHDFKIRNELNTSIAWDWSELLKLSYQYGPQQIIDLQADAFVEAEAS